MLPLSSVTGALAVILGAMGAHGPVAVKLQAMGTLGNWQTASHYHLLHAVLLLSLALSVADRKGTLLAWRLIAAGIFLFSGSLYVLSLTGAKWLGAITPLGGLCMILGWLATLRIRK